MDAQPAGDATPTPATAKRSGSRSPRRGSTRMRTVHETSAGGLVIDGIDGPRDAQVAALIGRVDRRGRLLWSLPKGHIELGETAEQTAIREVAEETGIRGSVLAALGRIDYWFVTDGRRVHKTVHHYLMRFLGGEVADELIDKLQSDGPAALPPLPPSSPRRRPQTHSRARHADDSAPGQHNGPGPGP